MTGEIDFAAVRRQIHTDRVIPFSILVEEGLIPDEGEETQAGLTEMGFVVNTLVAKRTGRSRATTTVLVLNRDLHTAQLNAATRMQYSGMGVGRRDQQIPPDSHIWRVQAEKTVLRTCEGTLIPGTVPDGLWHQPLPDGGERLWIIEYSSGSYSRARLRAKILAYGCNPQIWITPSKAHGDVIEELINELFVDPPLYRILTINWTGASV